MSTQKKFGTFSGVLTPSLLTILGVIMYMRLGSVVGYSSGIFQVVLIIVFSHLISVTTGLSVSSIATDKKIDKGGIYYMLTRSLGLPIGGAIGLTIFFATAFSIALYLIGFSESIIPVLDDAFGIGTVSINKLRIVGTFALLLVMVVAYISTSFALKIQYVILGLIILSLGSIFLGSSEGLKVGVDRISSPNFSVLFGIFFPAVTGFTAGVAMSGDLKNPRISIPWGTMLSIVIGLVVYITLAFFIYYNIDAEILRTNNNVLIQFGAIPILVLGGVWGATLSSALGGILGGPRILQAMSIDHITPKIFSKGHGVNNEPRNALILTFIIAELGILIGELNVIAELVAMFYMAAYLFINISCFLEQWSSPDFRPKFKIPIAISLVGAVATFLLMIQLNLAATLVAVIVMMAFWFWLSKKDLVLGTGDVWFSVWTSIVKTALKNLQKKSVHKRNWQPNILLFSGGTQNRPHLIEFGKSIMGRGGMVSNFDLIEVDSASTLFPKSHQIVKDEQITDDSIFHRRLYCQNIFKGIETIANTYGFSGVDPNTILMGWARNTKDPKWFGEMTNKLKDLDYNILYLDYDQKRGFGKYAEINIWWSEFNKQNELGLQMVKFLRSSAVWKNASLKIFYVNNEKIDTEEVSITIQSMIERKRMRAEIIVLNNVIENKSMNDLIRTRSYESDLILMDLPPLKKGKEREFITASNLLFTSIGSALFIEASSSFVLKKENEEIINTVESPKKEAVVNQKSERPKIIKTYDQEFDNIMMQIQEKFIDFNNQLSSSTNELLDELTAYYQKILDAHQYNSDTIYQLYDSEYVLKLSEEIAENFSDNLDVFYNEFSKFIFSQPKYIWLNLQNDFLLDKNLSKLLNSTFVKKHLDKLRNGQQVKIKIPLNKLLVYRFRSNFIPDFTKLINDVGLLNLKYLHQFKIHRQDEVQKDNLNKIKSNVLEQFNQALDIAVSKLINAIIQDFVTGNLKSLIAEREEEFNPKKFRNQLNKIDEFTYWFGKNIFILHNHKIVHFAAEILKEHASSNIDLIYHNLKRDLVSNYQDKVQSLKLSSLKTPKAINKVILSFEQSISYSKKSLEKTLSKIDITGILDNLPVELDIYGTSQLDSFADIQTNLVEKPFYLSATMHHIYHDHFVAKLKSLTQENEDWIIKHTEELINALKLLVFTMENQDNDDLIKEVKEKLKNRITEYKSNLSIWLDRIQIQIDELNVSTDLFLNEEFVYKHNSRRDVRSNDTDLSVFKRINSWQIQLSERFSIFLDRLNREKVYDNFRGKADKLKLVRDFISKTSIDSSITQKNAEAYYQFFNTKAQPNKLYNSFIKKQINSLNNAYRDLDKFEENVVIISGDPSSGKSYIIDTFIKSHKHDNICFLNAPNEITPIDVAAHINSNIYSAKETNGKITKLNDLPKGSIVILNDFEFWWRKSFDGLININELFSIFSEYKDSILFMIETNALFLKHLLACSALDSHVMNYVFTSNFSAKMIDHLLTEKNKMADKPIFYKGSPVTFGSLGNFSSSIKKLTIVSDGNVGWLYSIWLSMISINDSEEIEISVNQDLVFPDVLSDEEIQILIQIYWHKSLSIHDLNNYYNHWGAERINQVLAFLKNEQIIYSKGDYFKLNKQVVPYLKSYFVDKNYIDS